MKRKSLSRRLLGILLAVTMIVPSISMNVSAAVGDLSNVSTGLTGEIDTADTISLPIEIYDYEADGMLFEYAEAYAGVSGTAAAKTAGDFGATWYEDYTIRTSVGGTINTGNYWSDVSLALKTGTYANYTRATWAGNTTANWTGNRAGVVLSDFSESSTYTTNQVRYMVIVFRSNVRNGNFTVGLNRANLNGAGTSGNYTGNIAVTTENNTNWTYAVLDLKTGTLGSNWSKGAVYGVYVGLPIDASGEWMDIAHVAYFSDKDMATKFGEYALTDGSDRGDNRGFGLLRSSRNQSGGNNYAGIIDETTTVEQLNTYGDTTSIDFSTLTTLGYSLKGTFNDNGIANVGLLESSLSAKGNPVYKEEVVTYVATLLKHSLEIPERTSDGWKNYRYVKGTASSVYGGTDLATALRSKIKGNMGSYAVAAGKNLVGTWSECGGNIASYYDAAYFLLNSIFVAGSYNNPQDDYNYLVLSAGTDSKTGDKVYVFDGGFSTSSTPASAQMAIDYNTTSHTIQNTSAAGKAHFVYEGTSTTTLNPFLPVTDRNNSEGQTKSDYYQDDGLLNSGTTKDTYVNRNYNFVIRSSGEFVYHADDELFFDFEGDDDVYLFINGELVMDNGSAHSINGVRFNLNDYVNAAKAGTLGSDDRNKKLSLEEGNTYSFMFCYMERHGYGSNMRISTNIHVTDPAMLTAKTAYQDSKQIDYGSIVDKDKVVEYGFAITNNGGENLYNLTFSDSDIGVALTYSNGLEVAGSRVYDVNGGSLEASDLTAVVSHPDYDDITVNFADNDALKAFLGSLTSDAVVENGGGLWIGSTVLIRGIGYKLSDAQIKAGVFDNTVLTTSTNKTKTKTLHGQATMRVFVPSDPMYYQWAGHDLVVNKEAFITAVLAAANTEGNILAGKVANLTTGNVNKIEETTSAGNTIDYKYVSISDNTMTINYPSEQTGAHVYYVKVTYNSSKNTVIVPVLVNVTDVKDKVYVLDYGLAADLTEDLYDQDTVTVPGRDTKYMLEGFAEETPSYAPNNIAFDAKEGDTFGPTDDGTYSFSGSSLTFTPGSFMDEINTVYTAIRVKEADFTKENPIGTVNINEEVEMYKSVTVLPATVVYYEDDFPAITYTEVENKIVEDGTSTNLKQNVDNDENYGHDQVYQVASNTASSAGRLTTITIDAENNQNVATFTFKGTGFELVSRTTAKNGATIIVTVEDANGEVVKRIPVITEFDNDGNRETDGGDEKIYQVPTVRVDGLTLGTYTVKISGILSYEYDDAGNRGDAKTTYLYVDGIRIYQPLGESNEHYTPEENGATFKEIRNLIADGSVGVVKLDDKYADPDEDITTISVSSGTNTWVENKNGDVAENIATTVDEYLLYGPNNEVYMEGTYSLEALAFYVQEIEPEGDEEEDVVHNLQIAMRGIDAGLFNGVTNFTPERDLEVEALVKYATKTEEGYIEWTELTTLVSSTEQYYTLDYTKCPYEEGKGYQVVITVSDPDDMDSTDSMVSFSNLKYNGLEIVATDANGNNIFSDVGSFHYIGGLWTEGAMGINLLSLDDAETENQKLNASKAPEKGDTEDSTDDPSETDPADTETGDSQGEGAGTDPTGEPEGEGAGTDPAGEPEDEGAGTDPAGEPENEGAGTDLTGEPEGEGAGTDPAGEPEGEGAVTDPAGEPEDEGTGTDPAGEPQGEDAGSEPAVEPQDETSAEGEGTSEA